MRYTIDNTKSINETLKLCIPGDIIYLKCGIYKEKVEIFKDSIEIIGEDQKNTIITHHDFYHKIMPDQNECNTFRTYTCYVGGNHVKISNLTIENSSVPSKKYGQAVALHVDGNDFTCENTILLGAQDTLFTGPLPKDLILRHQGFLSTPFLKGTPSFQYYKNCIIKGDVDFIFGCATALFENCTLTSICRNTPSNPGGYVCAPAHDVDTKFGYLFLNCKIEQESNVENVFLARPWRDYGCSAFINCQIGQHIHPLGYDKWGNTHRDKTARFYEYTPTADISSRVSWSHILSEKEAETYVTEFFSYYNKGKNGIF